MPRGHKKYESIDLKVIFLLMQYILIKIGQAEILIIRTLFKSLWFIIKHTLKTPVYILKIALYLLPTTKLPRQWRGRGRPRKQWFLPYYIDKFKLYYKRRVSRKTKISFALAVIILLLYIYTSFILVATYQLPSPERLTSTSKALTTEFFDRNGKLLYRLYEGRNRILVKVEELPPYVIQATLAAEDKNFYKHFGIDPVAITRAFMANLKKEPGENGTSLEGASTLTQQLIKNTLLTPEKTYTRKIKEIILAVWAERIYSKNQILQMYVNEAPYGGPIWGIEAAAETYFGVSAKNLTLAQAAFLAGLPVSPTQFSPYGQSAELGKQRQKEVLRRMIENKYINQYQADLALSEDLHIKPPMNNIQAPHFVMYVKDFLSEKFGQRVVSQGGLKITTTLDSNIQK